MTSPGMRHLPTEPAFTCGVCGELWLCPDGRAELLAVLGADSVELRRLLDFGYRKAISNYKAHGCPKPTEAAFHIYGWLVALDSQQVSRPVLVNEASWPTNRPRDSGNRL